MNKNSIEEQISTFIHRGGPTALQVCNEAGLTEADFEDPHCRTVFQVANELAHTKQIVFPELIQETIRKRKLMPDADFVRVTTQPVGLSSLQLRPLCFDLRRRVHEGKVRHYTRFLAKALQDENPEMAADLLRSIESAEFRPNFRPKLTWEQTGEVIEAEIKAIMAGLEPNGISTFDWPWPSISDQFGEFRRGQLCVIAGDLSSGKSSLMRQFLLHAAGKSLRCFLASLEIARGDVQNLLAAGISGQSWPRLKNLHPEDESDFMSALRMAKDLPLKVVDNPTSLEQITQAITQANESYLDVIGIDHLELVKECKETEMGSRASNTGSVVADFKRLAIELNCLIFLGVQLNGDPTREGNREPDLWDLLKVSGDIEAHADRVLMLHRPNEDPYTKMAQKTHTDPSEQPRFFQTISQEKGRNIDTFPAENGRPGVTRGEFYFRRGCAKFELSNRG